MTQNTPDPPSLILPMTSIGRTEDPAQAEASDVSWYLTVLGEQSRLALLNLTHLWAFEGDPPDPTVWTKANAGDMAEMVWADLQGALFAGIVVSRMLKPSEAVRGGPALQERANARGATLRTLLNVADNSPLLSIGKVRDAFEHLDEYMDRALHAGDVHSVSDLAINWGGYFESLTPEDAKDQGGARHVNMRAFAPDIGYLIYDDKRIDLWDWEVALHNLLAAIREVHDRLPATDEGMSMGSSKPLLWPVEGVAARRTQIQKVRAQIRTDGNSMLRPSRPGTVVLVMQNPPEAPAG